MSEKKTVNDKLSDALDVNFETKEKEETSLTAPDEKQKRLAPSPETTVQDYNLVRNNLKELISTGEDAVEGILKVAMEGDSPRAFEVAAQMIKTVAETNKQKSRSIINGYLNIKALFIPFSTSVCKSIK